MKKNIAIFLGVLLALVSCNSEDAIISSDNVSQKITFNLKAKYQDDETATRAVKSDWEEGDVIFVIFSGLESPNYLKLELEGGEWIATQMTERHESTLSLNEGDEGTMTAIFLPFSKKSNYIYDAGGSYTFSEIYMSYYLTDNQPYTVVDGNVEGVFNMKIPDGFVQFYIEDDDAEEGKAMLREPNIMPYATTGVAAGDLTINFAHTVYGNHLPGFKYGNGYIFSGMLAESAQNDSVKYNFSRFMGADYAQTATTPTPRKMQATGKTGRAANITRLNWSKPIKPQLVDLGLPSGTKWADINLGAAVPTDYGAYYAWAETHPKVTYWTNTYKWVNEDEKLTKYCVSTWPERWNGEGEPDDIRVLMPEDDAAIACWGEGWQIPTMKDCEELIKCCEWTWYDDYEDTGISGYLVEGNNASIFLPAGGFVYDFGSPTQGNLHGYYWTRNLDSNPTCAKTFEFYDGANADASNSLHRYNGALIRPVWKEQ